MERDAFSQVEYHNTLDSQIPEEIRQRYIEYGGHVRRLKLALATDLAANGVFGEQWLLVDDAELQVIALEQGRARVVFHIPLDDLEAAQIEPCVGNGLLKVTVCGQPQILLHFTNEQTERFALVAHYLRQRIEMGPEAQAPDFEGDLQRCLSCGRRLLDPSLKVCPSCIKRGQVLRRLFSMAKPYWGPGLIHFALMLAGVMVDLLPPFLTRVLIDDVLTNQVHTHWLPWLVLSLLGLQIVRVTITISDALLTNRISTQFAAGVREKMFAHLKKLSQDFF